MKTIFDGLRDRGEGFGVVACRIVGPIDEVLDCHCTVDALESTSIYILISAVQILVVDMIRVGQPPHVMGLGSIG